MSELVTGEAVPLELRLAKLPSRALAIMIDLLVLAAIGVGLFLLLGQIVPDVDGALAAALVLAGSVLVVVGVPTTVETLTRGRSIGKVVLGLRVVRDDGGPVQFRHALVRALAGVFADFVITSGAGAVICSILNERGKRIGDVLAGTVVVRERIPSTRSPLPAVPPQLSAWATGLEMSRLPDGLAQAARTYLTRAPQLSPEARTDLGERLATEVASVVTPPSPPGTPAWAYLAAVLAERHRREALRLGDQARPPAPATSSAPADPPGRPVAGNPAPSTTADTGMFRPPE